MPAAAALQSDLRAQVCLAHLGRLSRALELYSADNDGAFPPANDWCDSTSAYLESPRHLVCPEASDLASGYAYNVELSGIHDHGISDPHTTILIFESNAGWNAAGGRELLPERPRHSGTDTYAMLDGRLVRMSRKHHRQEARGKEVWSKRPDADWMRWQPLVTKSDERPMR
jgi:hypothetical protein